MWFSTHRIPENLESDDGSQFTLAKFLGFINQWKFNYWISNPRYPKSNGFAERNIQAAKHLLKKCYSDNTDMN